MLIKIRESMKRKDNQKGFTLIELIVVMAILAILAALAIPKFTGVITKAQQDANNSNVDLIAHAAETYYDSHSQSMPADIATLKTEGYLKDTPKQQIKGADNYTISSSGTTLTVKPGYYDFATKKIEASHDFTF